jgi:branched-chain amino acid transport system ATP-binding protein
MLSVENLRSGYGRIVALHGVSIMVASGEIVTLLGANGAGKTTLLRAISGVQPIGAGSIYFDDRRIDRLPDHARWRSIAQVPEAAIVPARVEDNLKLGAWTRRSGDFAPGWPTSGLFPMLAELRRAARHAMAVNNRCSLSVVR